MCRAVVSIRFFNLLCYLLLELFLFFDAVVVHYHNVFRVQETKVKLFLTYLPMRHLDLLRPTPGILPA